MHDSIHLKASALPVIADGLFEPLQATLGPGFVPGFYPAAQGQTRLRSEQYEAAGDDGAGAEEHLLANVCLADADAVDATELDGVNAVSLAVLQDEPMGRVRAGGSALGRRAMGSVVGGGIVGDANNLAATRALAPGHGLELLDLVPARESKVLDVEHLDVDVAGQPGARGVGGGGGDGRRRQGGHQGCVEQGRRRAGHIARQQAGFGRGDQRRQRRRRRARGHEGGEEGGRGRGQGACEQRRAKLRNEIHPYFSFSSEDAEEFSRLAPRLPERMSRDVVRCGRIGWAIFRGGL